MKLYLKVACFFLMLLVTINCTPDDSQTPPIENPNLSFKYLALGDSYTIGQSVCETCRFPIQLRDSLQNILGAESMISVKIIAQTGWTTSNLKAAIDADTSLATNYDLVTLLIGVNNQYQNKPFSLYESEFPQLVTKAIALASGDKSNVVVVSIPDYSYTPFGQNGNATTTSTQIAQYNDFAENYCIENDIEFVGITDITQQGLVNPELVASDGLHPSEIAYSEFVNRIIPLAILALQ